MIFKVEDREIHLHKIILVCKSPVFAAMFEHAMTENHNNTVVIVDISYKVLKEMLRFIYTGEVYQIKDVAEELIIAADKYCIKDLKLECEEVLSRNITLDNVLACLILANHYNTQEVIRALVNS